MPAATVVVDARFLPGLGGGIETVAVGLAEGFAGLALPDLAITFLTYGGSHAGLAPMLGPGLRSVQVLPPAWAQPGGSAARCPPASVVRRLASGFAGLSPWPDPAIAGLGADLVHFPFQRGAAVRAPFIYHPHDLQHRHLPEFFTRRQIIRREVVYRYLCHRATAVAVGTTWVKQDLVEGLGVDPAKVFVVPLAPLDLVQDAVQPPGLPPRYAVYPAAPWPHKNHARLFEALALLRRRGVDVPLVLTGPRVGQPGLDRLADAAGVADLVHDLGYLPRAQAQAVVAGAAALVLPTLFEAASFPIWEAFQLGTPVACSTVTSLPAQVGDAALLFDPREPAEIARCLDTLWHGGEEEAQRLVRRGQARVAGFSWKRTATQFAALYRHVLGRQLTPADQKTLHTTLSL